MKLYRWAIAFILPLLLTLAVMAAPKEKEPEPEGQKIDSGSFGVFMNGHRVGTETFSIYQGKNGSVVDSEFKTEGASEVADQSSQMHLTPNGEIRRYEWKELSPGKAQLTIVPNDQLLVQKWTAGPGDKEHEQPYLLTPSTSILDDYFFVHREVLAWKFLAAACKQDKGQIQCPVRQRAKFSTMNPHQHSSSPDSMEFLGRDKINLKGSMQELNKLELNGDSVTWYLWLDDQFMVQRISIVGENTEVIRD